MIEEFKNDLETVKFERTREKEKAVFDKIIEFCKRHNCFFGECIMQSDDPQIYAPELISEIVDDIIEFEVEDI
jgi:hypothetical protein